MSSHGLKRDSSQSGTPQPLIPQQRPKLSIPHVTTTFAPSIPKVVKPSLSFVSSPQLHDIAIRPSLPPQMHRLVVGPTLSPQLQSQGIESSHSLSPSPPPAQVPSPQMSSPRTESSHTLTPQGVGGRLSPWGRDPVDGRRWIYPEEKTFNPVVCSVRQILLVIQRKFNYPCHSWKATPANYRKMWFEEWARKYKWLPEYEDDVKKIWNAKCSNILRGTMLRIRQDLFHKQVRPKWIPLEVMNQLERVWTSPEYLSKCDIAKINRASNKEGTQYKGGSIPNTEHKRRMAEDLGREPSIFELFKKTHYNEKIGKFVDHHATATHDEFLRLKASVSSEEGSVQSNQDKLNLWLEVTSGKNKKGRIYGLGFENEHIGSSASATYINSTENSNVQEWQTEITQMRKECARLKQTSDMIMSALQAMGIQLPNLSKPTNDEAPSATNANKDAKNDN
ncbi:hypothetical protein QN277_016721 [Acacia crassicarpa]|uniref:Transposase, Ptta/En/Spm, plant n=1 Tax=Acacia crassicarpa TaxID=499986 RepID=A0AAE1MXH7_9FABA|nr:hypothetical protein QN277_016721 [Acacia crassicarpa]